MAGAEAGSYARGVDTTRTALLAQIDAWMTAARALQETLVDNGAQLEKGREMVAQGMGLVDALATMSTTPRFLRMRDALAEFEMARFALRSTLVKTALAEGLSGPRLVELLGVPPELTAVILGEMQEDPEGSKGID